MPPQKTVRVQNGDQTLGILEFIWSTRDEMAPPSDATRVRQRCCYTHFTARATAAQVVGGKGESTWAVKLAHRWTRSVSCVRSCVRVPIPLEGWLGHGTGEDTLASAAIGVDVFVGSCQRTALAGTFVECTTMPSTPPRIVNFMPCFLKSDPTCHNCCAMVAGSCLCTSPSLLVKPMIRHLLRADSANSAYAPTQEAGVR